ncbi:MAG: hypothetical protein ACYC1D_00365 [Acidimicrobiales bacterium]
MAETRTDVPTPPRRWVIRCLVVDADQDRVSACCVGGDKAHWERTHPGGPIGTTRSFPSQTRFFDALTHLQEGWTT